MADEPVIEDNDICSCGKLIVLIPDDVDCGGDPPYYVTTYVWIHEDGSRACEEYAK